MSPFVKLHALFRYYLRFLRKPKPHKRHDILIVGKEFGHHVIVLNEEYPGANPGSRNKLVQSLETGKVMHVLPEWLLGSQTKRLK